MKITSKEKTFGIPEGNWIDFKNSRVGKDFIAFSMADKTERQAVWLA